MQSRIVGDALGMHHLEDCDGAFCKLWELMLQIVPVTEESVIVSYVESLPIMVCMLVVVLCTTLSLLAAAHPNRLVPHSTLVISES